MRIAPYDSPLIAIYTLSIHAAVLGHQLLTAFPRATPSLDARPVVTLSRSALIAVFLSALFELRLWA